LQKDKAETVAQLELGPGPAKVHRDGDVDVVTVEVLAAPGEMVAERGGDGRHEHVVHGAPG
jgi:hypothetical protein